MDNCGSVFVELVSRSNIANEDFVEATHDQKNWYVSIVDVTEKRIPMKLLFLVTYWVDHELPDGKDLLCFVWKNHARKRFDHGK